MPLSVYDVVVAGGGPVGSVAAYVLASGGASVAVIDRATFPREKPCGGGLQARLLPHLPFAIDGVPQSTLCGVEFSLRLDDRFVRRSDRPLVYGVLRRDFDHFLLERAAAAGAVIHEGLAVRAFEDDARGPVTVRTDRGAIRARVAIGADGMNGAARRHLNDEAAFFRQAALYCEIPRECVRDGAIADDVLRLDWGTLPTGYAWAFPKRTTVNVGVGGPAVFGRRLRGYITDFVERERLLRPGVPPSALAVRGFTLATMTDRTRLQRGRVLLAGDAAGLVEAFTGDGLSHGIHSARVAADHAARWLGGDAGALDEYPGAIDRGVRPPLVEGRQLMAFFNTFVDALHRAFRRDARAWEDLCAILAGRAGFDRFYRRRLGVLSGLKPWLDRFSAACERRRFEPATWPPSPWLDGTRAVLSAAIDRL